MRWVVFVLALVACASEASPPVTGADGAPSRNTGPASDLAPSQVSAPTVPRPETPPPCHSDDLVWWTAQVAVGEVTSDAVLRVRNDGDDWCEPDISGSPSIDPLMEPDVWLEPGDWADVVVGQMAPCGESGSDRVVETLLPVDLNGETVIVPTALVTCGWWLTAFSPNEGAVDPCSADSLAFVLADTALIVRNLTFEPCVLGDLMSAIGADLVERAPATIEVPALAGGDVAEFALRESTRAGCSNRSATLEFSAAGKVDVATTANCLSIERGPARPLFDGSTGVLRDVTDGAVALALLAQVFGSG